LLHACSRFGRQISPQPSAMNQQLMLSCAIYTAYICLISRVQVRHLAYSTSMYTFNILPPRPEYLSAQVDCQAVCLGSTSPPIGTVLYCTYCRRWKLLHHISYPFGRLVASNWLDSVHTVVAIPYSILYGRKPIPCPCTRVPT